MYRRFMGELFMQNGFKMTTIIMKTVSTFIRAHDAHSLECLCVLLTIIGSKFEKVISPPPPQTESIGFYESIARVRLKKTYSIQYTTFSDKRCLLIVYGKPGIFHGTCVRTAQELWRLREHGRRLHSSALANDQHD